VRSGDWTAVSSPGRVRSSLAKALKRLAGRADIGAAEPPHGLIRITISPAAFEAIKATLPIGTVAFDPKTGAKGDLHI
jgi:hypothetical protein